MKLRLVTVITGLGLMLPVVLACLPSTGWIDSCSGSVIGVNAQIESNSNDNAGVGFAIPIDAVKSVADTIISGGTVQHAYLGVQIGDTSAGTGAQVTRVVSGLSGAASQLASTDRRPVDSTPAGATIFGVEASRIVKKPGCTSSRGASQTPLERMYVGGASRP